ncbi:MAG: SRPBCC domain-containing protein [Chloroflexota bacterium]|nr:SRPBCC domain-containing protein [Chloroflexota bacterium]MCY3647595.1 SRPBCC domain-containing protein [Chloroflexota bacterium]MDE2668490.1 SRPBCC domain-containing protein [Chloroflexota bacterium]
MVEIEGEHRFEAAKDALWQALFDPATLRAALPAFESLERIDEDTYELVAFVEVRGFWGRFRGLARVSHIVEGQSYHLRLSGAAAEGTAMAQGTITLHEDEEGVLFRYRGDLTVHGALTRLGGRFIGGSIRILIRDFLQGLARNLAGEPPDEQPE